MVTVENIIVILTFIAHYITAMLMVLQKDRFFISFFLLHQNYQWTDLSQDNY